MYEQPESDLLARKPRNVSTELLTDWLFFFQIYLLHWFDDVALLNEHVVPLHVRTKVLGSMT